MSRLRSTRQLCKTTNLNSKKPSLVNPSPINSFLVAYKDVCSELNNEQLRLEIKRIKQENITLKEQFDLYEAGAVKLVSEEDIAQAKKDVARYCLEWRRRKRECNEIVDQICESADLKKKDFMSKIGLEVDEDYNVNVNDYIKL